MAKIKQINADGIEEEIDVFTPEEVQAKEDEHLKNLGEKDTAITNLAKDKTDLEAKIAKLELDGIKADHPNFKILKDALAKKDGDLIALKTEIDEDKKTRKQDEINSLIKIASKGNEELEKKVKLHLEKTLAALPENTKEERQIKIEAALKLSADYSSQGIFDNGIGGGGSNGSFTPNEGSKVEFSGREKALGAKMGITDEDYRKYGNKLTNKQK